MCIRDRVFTVRNRHVEGHETCSSDCKVVFTIGQNVEKALVFIAKIGFQGVVLEIIRRASAAHLAYFLGNSDGYEQIIKKALVLMPAGKRRVG